MAWFADLAGKAETLLNNIDEQTGVALRNHSVTKSKKHDFVLQPDRSWTQKKRSLPQAPKKMSLESRSNPSPSKKFSQSNSHAKESENNVQDQIKKKSPAKKTSPKYTTNNFPKMSFDNMNLGDTGMENYGLKRRRNSLPNDLEALKCGNIYKMQNLEVENAMLKNEINVMNREITELLDRLRKTEDEFGQFKNNQNNIELQNHKLKLDNESLKSQLDNLRLKLQDLNSIDVKNREHSEKLEAETTLLRSNNRQLEEKLKLINEELSNKESTILRLENELRHTQVVISEQQGSIEKSTLECQRLETDWESYKLRVKGMLYAKDEEIKKLRQGTNLTEDTKILIEQIEILKEEREELSDALSRVKEESENIKESMSQMEARHTAAQRIVLALRDALKEERSARSRAEMQCVTLGKELKAMHTEMSHTITNLRSALQEKEEELSNVRETSSPPTADTSALNVADYDVAQVAMDKEKIQYLTQTLVQKQGKIESLLADNNTLKIQLEKLATKHKAELAALRPNYSHSIVQVQDGDVRPRSRTNNYSPATSLAQLSLRVGVLSKRYPIFRVFIIFYMIGLHLWVFTVLFTSTPEDYIRPSKS
ncbi:unnamed protein product [Parnassius apollo]|uniref:(apollo) hypothetical protein n=1 Tax=Parnassius apollo TaxID=110799 RepID=A0A8S3WFL8_PARAO|nr:unnamed protein product [Parnassius apollo]